MNRSLLFFSCVLSLPLFSQTSQKGWTVKYEPAKDFIENKSQFDGRDRLNDSKILFAIDQNGTQIYFTKKGLTYRFDEAEKKQKNESEREKENKKITAAQWAEHEKEERSVNIKTELVHMQWENSNPNVQLVAEDEETGYYSYTKSNKENINHIKGYKKLIYKDLYPNIDVEYVFHPQGGIKYSLILHPGADASQVKMAYSNDKKISFDKNGNIHISTLFGDIIDHAPTTFYDSKSPIEKKSLAITSNFVKKGNLISFLLAHYDNTKTIVIDPWVQTPTIPNSNSVWECEHDGAGNVYIIGGDMPMQLLKYNASGVLQWTYNTPFDTSGASNSGGWLGTFATDFNGNSYVTMGATAALIKVNSSAGLVYSVTGGSTDEYWNIAFNCDQTKLIIAGTRLAIGGMAQIIGYGVIFDINASSGSVNSLKRVGYVKALIGANSADEVRSICPAHNGKYYFLTLDTIGYISQNFSACSGSNGALFAINSTYDFAYYNPSYRYNNSGIMAIRANKNFLYAQNGASLSKRSLGNLGILSTVSIPGGINVAGQIVNPGRVPGCSGTDLDSCGNIYVGSSNAIIKYDANLNQLSSVALPYTVFDVSVNINGDVIVAGSTTQTSGTRTGYVQAISSFSACNPLKLECCDATVCKAGPFCTTDSPVTLSSSTSGGTWSGTGITNPSNGTFSPAVAGQGTFAITYNLGCGSDSMQIVVKNCALPTVCLESNGNLTASGGAGPTYTWYKWNPPTTVNVTNQATCQQCGGTWNALFSQCLNGVTPVTSCTAPGSWQQFSSGATATPPGTYPLEVQDGSGNSYTVTSTSGLPSCSNTLSANATSTNILCNGSCSGKATVTASSGTSPYTYAWSPSGGNSSSASGLCAGAYTVLVTDASNATATATVNITQPANAIAATASVTSSSCGGT
ncbi:MAG TPA: SprB repeat-containing protein, partial [Bacteroidia bacterium]